MRKMVKAGSMLAMALLFLSACDQQTTTHTATTGEKPREKVVVTYVTAPLNVPSILEKENQVFAKHLNTEIEYAEITSGAEQSQALASGDVHILHAIGGSSVVAAAAGGADIKILNMYSRAPQAFALYSKDETINSPSALVGKTIAGPAGTNLHELLVAYLDKEGLSIHDVNFVSMGIADAYAGLEGGSVDVALLGGPAAYQAEKAGFHKVTDGKGYIEAIICVATSQAYYREHKDVIDAFLAAQKELRAEMHDHPAKVKEIVKSALNLDDQAFDTMFSQYDFDLDVKEQDIVGLQKTADFMLKNKMIKKAVDARSLFLNQ